MIQENTKQTEVIRIPTLIMDKIRTIARENGQSYRGYLTISLRNIVNRDYMKIIKRKEKNEQKKSS